MSEKRYELDVRMDMPKLLIDNVTNKRYHLLLVNDIEEIVDVLNTQQTTINKQLDQIIELQDKYRILEFNHSRLEKRNKAQYEKIGEQQATISALKEENEQLRVLLKEAEQEIDRLKKSNLEFMKTLVNKESEKEDNQETEVRECQFCGEFRTEYHEYEDYSWSAEDYCNAGHDLEDTDPNSCKDYWVK